MRALGFCCCAFVFGVSACSSDVTVGERPGAIFGVASGDGAGAAGVTRLETIETSAGRVMGADRIYRQWDTLPGDAERATLAAGRIPVVSFNGRQSGAADVTWADVASGAGDAHLKDLAAAFQSLGQTALAIYHQDSDKDSPEFGTPAEFRAAYRHVVNVFRAAGADNVVWVFAMRSTAFPSQADSFFPGADVVDWIGENAYNYGTSSSNSRWLSLRALVSDFVGWSKPYGKPLMLAEFGCVEDPANPSHKVAWLTEAIGAFDDTPEIRLAAYFDQEGQFASDSSPAAAAAFKALALSPHFAVAR